jgi:hypothetical protein
LTILTLTVLTACKDYYNDTVKWTDNIKIGTDIQTVKNNQPDFLEIDWAKPDTIGIESFYLIKKIKGNKDVLAMSNYLVFTNGKYQGRKAHK